MEFPGNSTSLTLGLGVGGGESSASHGQRTPDTVWDLPRNNPNYGFLGHVPNVSQLGISRLYAANEFRKATITPYTLRVHSMLEYHHVPDKPGVTLPLFRGTGEVSVAEIVRPSYPHALLNGDRLVLSKERPGYLRSNMAPLLGDPLTNVNDIRNEANKRVEFPMVAEQADPWALPRVVENPPSGYNNKHNEVRISKKPIDVEPLRFYIPTDVRDGNNIARTKVETNNDDKSDTASASMNGRRHNYRRARSEQHKKYGPYTCPRCMDVFPTSQSFAAHVSGHYRRDGGSTIREPITSLQNAAKKLRKANRRLAERCVPYTEPRRYVCSRCNVELETPHAFAAHLSSHYKEEVCRGPGREATNDARQEIPTPNPFEEAATLLPVVDWLALTLKKVLARRRKRSADQNINTSAMPPPGNSSSSSSSAPWEAVEAPAVKMDYKAEEEDEVVEVDAFGSKIKKEPWST
ncbi:hypothetical protein MLD38_007347 [Melastoma candidum]|uniref:Uncharacterized protein n=1 Tax=Melastoma candidum TaxID=119954 RepID=A0ACB9RQB6_9MYRT|nr:hypothetical protein MLD38_007347 [Melastoma candidum]